VNVDEAFGQRLKTHVSTFALPLVTLTYAQSLDGCIAIKRDQQLKLSGDESQRMTHHLRALHDAILVGIGTVLADDPRLSVRLIDGKNPQPIVVDTHLRFPLNARLLREPIAPLWIVADPEADPKIQAGLIAAGAEIIPIPVSSDNRVNLPLMLQYLFERGIRSLMVEGGARIITSFLQEHLADWAVLTIAPRYVGGLNVIDGEMLRENANLPQLNHTQYAQMGDDIVVWGDLKSKVL